jgi:hypothetical protein
MVNASYATVHASFTRRLMMNKSLLGCREESSGKGIYGFQAVGRGGAAGARI